MYKASAHCAVAVEQNCSRVSGEKFWGTRVPFVDHELVVDCGNAVARENNSAFGLVSQQSGALSRSVVGLESWESSGASQLFQLGRRVWGGCHLIWESCSKGWELRVSPAWSLRPSTALRAAEPGAALLIVKARFVILLLLSSHNRPPQRLLRSLSRVLRCTCVMRSCVAIPAVPSAPFWWRGHGHLHMHLLRWPVILVFDPAPAHPLIGLRCCLLVYLQVPPINDASNLSVVRLTKLGRVNHCSLVELT